MKKMDSDKNMLIELYTTEWFAGFRKSWRVPENKEALKMAFKNVADAAVKEYQEKIDKESTQADTSDK